ncbi:MAG: Hsp20/alpha crystallin family protein [Bacteroidetes bacterium]|nr:Hsp20/alpha crystallin family protein [Bacteroidota bacterium]
MLRKQCYAPNYRNDFFGKDFLFHFLENETENSVPAVNVVETKDSYKINVAAPGYEKDAIKVDVQNNLLIISAEKKESKEENDERTIRREFGFNSFKRSFTLPELVDYDNISATHKNGILNIEIPKREEAKEKPARQISIS